MRTTPDLRHVPHSVAARAALAVLAPGALLLGACGGNTANAGASMEGPTVTATTSPAGDGGSSFSPPAVGFEPTALADPVSLGGPGPIDAGETVETPNLGGLHFVAPEDRFLHQSPGLVVIEERGVPADIVLVPVIETLEGEPIDTVDTVVGLIDEVTVALDETTATTIAGHEARVFDFKAEPDRVARPQDAVFRFLENCDCGWGPVGEGRAWLLDTPRGILLFSAQVLQPGGADLADVIAEAEAVFATLELVDVGSGASSSPDAQPLVGTWRNPTNGRHMTYTAAGEFSVKENGDLLAQGTYAATATTIDIIPGSGSIACDATGTYGWEVEDDTLTLTVVQDECAGRKTGLDGVTLERVQ